MHPCLNSLHDTTTGNDSWHKAPFASSPSCSNPLGQKSLHASLVDGQTVLPCIIPSTKAPDARQGLHDRNLYRVRHPSTLGLFAWLGNIRRCNGGLARRSTQRDRSENVGIAGVRPSLGRSLCPALSHDSQGRIDPRGSGIWILGRCRCCTPGGYKRLRLHAGGGGCAGDH